MNKRIECVVSGKVQMVMFRDFTKRNARKLGLLGFVKNNGDGTVTAVAEGDEEELKQLIALLHKGSVLARVSIVDVAWGNPTGEFNSFDITY